MSETEQFICNIKRYCAKKGYSIAGFLAVRLFETGGSLAAGYIANQEGVDTEAFGILQWTPSGVEPLQKALGVAAAHTRENNVAAYYKMRGKSRLEQLDFCFKYYDFWEPYVLKNNPLVTKDSVLFQYIITLSPGASGKQANGNFRDRGGKGVTAAEIVKLAKFKSLLAQAEGMLNGTVPVPNDDGKQHKGYKQNAAHVKRMGTSIVNPSTCDVTVSVPTSTSPLPSTAAPVAGREGRKTIEDLLPMQITFSIPEYPRFTALKPGDVIVLPESATYRDWFVTSVTRELNQGINKLTIQANRGLAAKSFVQKEIINKVIPDYSSYYWLK